MITTVEEAVRYYREALDQYRRYSESFPPGPLGNAAWHEFEVKNARLRGMIEVLGLSDEEERRFDHEVGIKHYSSDPQARERALEECCRSLAGSRLAGGSLPCRTYAKGFFVILCKDCRMKRLIIGIDEVGRGALAGPVVVAGVSAFRSVSWNHPELGRIRDSKQLTPRRREIWALWLRAHPGLVCKISFAAPKTIDRVNVSRAANHAALRLARKLDPSRAGFIWLDGGLRLPGAFQHRAVVKGDERMPIIAAASIIAKVWRDRWMARADGRFPGFGFSRHKGYGTAAHFLKLRANGRSNIHRASFLTRYPDGGNSGKIHSLGPV